MEDTHQPNDIAREAIKRLAVKKQPPIPDNYRRAYFEVQGGASVQSVWPETIRGLLGQWESYQAGLTQAKKREMLDRVLINFGNEPDRLAAKLSGLARSWGESGQSAPVEANGSADGQVAKSSSEPAAPGLVGNGAEAIHRLQHLIHRSLDALSGGCRIHWPDLAGRVHVLSIRLGGDGYALLEQDIEELATIWREIVVRADDDVERLGAFKRLLTLLFGNISELVSEDAWLSGQMTAMQAILSDNLNPHALFQAEQSLKEVVNKQKSLMASMDEAKDKLKRLISSFIDRVGGMSADTGRYNARIKEYSERIAKAEDIAELSDVIDGLSTDMAELENVMADNHRELQAARDQAEEAENRVQALEKELEEVASLVREDQLTGALNRRGMEEAFGKELARAERMAAPLAIGLLDIDHFKRLNDGLGHQAGDQALVHLAHVVRQLLRPTDSLARYGGEEFLLLLPNSDLDSAEKILLRVQRELTKQFFLHENQRVLITFSAGVAQLQPGESQSDLIKRADEAMYRAKAAGRNRVERA